MTSSVYHSFHDTELIRALKAGGVGIVPTDTVYGIVCCARQVNAVKKLYALKSREHKPGTVVAASIEQLAALGIKRSYLKAVEQFWPNALSVIIPVGQDLDYLSQEKRSLAVRIPAEPHLRELLQQTGPLLTTSANHPGAPTANNAQEAIAYFGDDVDFYADAGDLSDKPPSTIIRIVDDAIEIVRPGAVKIDEATGSITE